MFDANITHLPKGEKFFAKCHLCTEESPLYEIGVRSGELYYCVMLSECVEDWEGRHQRKVAIRVDDKMYVIGSSLCEEDSFLVYKGSLEGAGMLMMNLKELQ